MSIRKKVAGFLYLVVAITSLIGLYYLLAPWPDLKKLLDLDVIEGTKLDAGSLLIIQAMVRSAGVGMFGAGLLMLALVFLPFREGKKWANWVIPGVGLALVLPFYAVGLFIIPMIPPRATFIFHLVVIIVAFILAYKQDDSSTA